MNKVFIISLTVLFIFCTKESKEQLLLERIDGIVWTRGTNFMTLQSNPFKLVLVEDGVCIDYTEELKLVRGNEIKYTILKNGADTLKLGLRATGENINHCGTFSYYFDDDNKLFRSYKECDSFYPESYTLSFYEADQSIDVLCPDL